jgi:diguanylate cyclase (GGDEF)-like protein
MEADHLRRDWSWLRFGGFPTFFNKSSAASAHSHNDRLWNSDPTCRPRSTPSRQLNDLLEASNIRLAGLASTDSLTGLANRRSFDEHLQREWARAGRIQKPLALIILDLDFFKQYNDQYGHIAGDECPKLVAKALQEGRRVTDLEARIGGEEFSLLLPDTEIEGAVSIAETIRVRIESLQLPHAKSPMGLMTASFGAAAAKPCGTQTTEDLVSAADRALYEAKRQGRNRVVRGPTLGEDDVRKKFAVATV